MYFGQHKFKVKKIKFYASEYSESIETQRIWSERHSIFLCYYINIAP